MIKKRTLPQVLLINPWIEDFAAYDYWAKPLGLLRIASWFDQNNLPYHFLDCLDMTHPVHSQALPHKPVRTPWGAGKYYKHPISTPQPLSHISRQWSAYGLPLSYIKKYVETIPSPDVVLIHTSMTYWYLSARKLVGLLQERFPRATIILGGLYTTLCYSHARSCFAPHYVHKGPGVPFLRKYFEESWNISMPFPDPLALPYPKHLYPGSDLGILSLSTGCPFKCTYCASSYLHPRFQKARLSFLKRELEHFATSSIRNVTFYDDALLSNAGDLLLPLLKWVEKQNFSFYFHLSNGVNLKNITPHIIQAFQKNNFITLRFGFETAKPNQQKKLGKKTDNQEFLQAARLLHEAGYSSEDIGVFLLAGYPGQTKEELKSSINFVLDNGAKPYISEYSPIPHTSLWKESCRISKYPLEQEPLFHNNTILPCEWNQFTFKDLRNLKKYYRHRLEEEFY